MTEAEKQNIFKMSAARKERDILVNQGIPTPLGTEIIHVKALTWDECDKFDEALAEAVGKFSEVIKIDLSQPNEINLGEIVNAIISIIQKDLLKIAEIATNGLVSLEKVKAVGATRDDVIQIVLKAFEANYKSIKNLLALTKSLR